MILRINDKPTDFRLEKEESLAEVLHAVISWLEQEGHVLTGVAVNGSGIEADKLEQAGNRDIREVESLDIRAVPWLGIYREALEETIRIFSLEGPHASSAWARSPAESFLVVRDRDLHRLAEEAVAVHTKLQAQNGRARVDGYSVVECARSRLLELDAPEEALRSLSHDVEELIPLLENLPLALQTGNDAEAAGTLALFVRIAGTLIRLVPILKASNLSLDGATIGDQPFHLWVEELHSVLSELVEGYTNGDIILVGDLAEYEIAPRFAALAPCLDRILAKGVS